MQALVPAFIVKIAVAGGSSDGTSLQATSSSKKTLLPKVESKLAYELPVSLLSIAILSPY